MSVTSRNLTWSRRLTKRSVIPPVGRPPDQNIASIEPSFMPSTVLPSSVRCAWMSLAGSSPAALSIRLAITSVPEFGAPGGHPLAAHVGDRVDAGVGAGDHLGVVGIQPGSSAAIGCFASNDAVPLTASAAVSAQRERDLMGARHQLLDVLQRRGASPAAVAFSLPPVCWLIASA